MKKIVTLLLLSFSVFAGPSLVWELDLSDELNLTDNPQQVIGGQYIGGTPTLGLAEECFLTVITLLIFLRRTILIFLMEYLMM